MNYTVMISLSLSVMNDDESRELYFSSSIYSEHTLSNSVTNDKFGELHFSSSIHSENI